MNVRISSFFAIVIASAIATHSVAFAAESVSGGRHTAPNAVSMPAPPPEAVPPPGGDPFSSMPGGLVKVDIPDYDRFMAMDANAIGYGELKRFRAPVHSYPHGIFARDVNGDGKKEVVFRAGKETIALDGDFKQIASNDEALRAVAEYDSAEGERLKSYENGSVKYKKGHNLVEIGGKTYKTSTGGIREVDLSGDGTVSVVIQSQDPTRTCVSHYTIFIFDPSGELVWNLVWPCWLGDVAFEDVDGDGAKEIIVADHEANIILFGRSANPSKGAGGPRGMDPSR